MSRSIRRYSFSSLADNRISTTSVSYTHLPETDNPKYTFRCWLLRLGFIGDEFETARLHLSLIHIYRSMNP